MERPDKIEKRVFTCQECEYSAQVFGETYFDSGSHNYMATFTCPECKVLFESQISQINMDLKTFKAEHGLADDIQCLRCGNQSSKVWNMETGKCPKCRSRMGYKVIGSIRVQF